MKISVTAILLMCILIYLIFYFILFANINVFMITIKYYYCNSHNLHVHEGLRRIHQKKTNQKRFIMIHVTKILNFSFTLIRVSPITRTKSIHVSSIEKNILITLLKEDKRRIHVKFSEILFS